jgi:hypothetical protein
MSSALGDPFNWNVYDGLSTDSYAVAVGTGGDFTGCAQYSSHICFFKEEYIHKLYGTKPDNYQITTVSVPGVQAGCKQSIKAINEVLYYKARTGVFAYTGGIPELISANFGVNRYFAANAESDGRKYYISMKDESENWALYVYDPLFNVWHKEEEIHVLSMCELGGEIYYATDSSPIIRVMGRASSTEQVEWMAQLVPFTEIVHNRKGYSKLNARIEIDPGAWIEVYAKADAGDWNKVYTGGGYAEQRTLHACIIPTRCDVLSVKFVGKGACLIKSLVREFTVGSEV